jgi:hypothetical protein
VPAFYPKTLILIPSKSYRILRQRLRDERDSFDIALKVHFKCTWFMRVKCCERALTILD